MPNTELLLILAAPDSALCWLSIYHQEKLWRGLDFHHSQLRHLHKDCAAGEALTALGWTEEEGTALGACPVLPMPCQPPGQLVHLTAHPVRGV